VSTISFYFWRIFKQLTPPTLKGGHFPHRRPDQTAQPVAVGRLGGWAVGVVALPGQAVGGGGLIAP